MVNHKNWMGDIQDILILLSFLLEVAVLFYLEMKAWKSLYTPLNFLMLPYTIVLLITIAISGNYGFVDFYYPSILFWSVGLLIFAIPSYVLAYILQKHNCPLESKLHETKMPKILVYIATVIILLFVYRLKSVIGGEFAIGSEDFGEEFCGVGLWGHLRLLLLPILMMAIYFLDKNSRWLWFIIIPMLVVALLYQVLGWIVIPCLAAISLRLYTGKTKLRLSLLLYVLLGVAIVFLGSYVMVLVIAGDSELNNEVLSFIFRNFVHYLTSGTLGFSVDMQQGYPDMGVFDIVIAQFVNIGKILSGDGELLSALNPLFYNTGVNWTNVRTLFGTVFINSGYLIFAIFVFVLSCIMYLLKLATIRYNNVFVYIIYFFECGLLFMGWFDSYFASLSIIEIPIWSLLLLLLCRMCSPMTENKILIDATEKIQTGN